MNSKMRDTYLEETRKSLQSLAKIKENNDYSQWLGSKISSERLQIDVSKGFQNMESMYFSVELDSDPESAHAAQQHKKN